MSPRAVFVLLPIVEFCNHASMRLDPSAIATNFRTSRHR